METQDYRAEFQNEVRSRIAPVTNQEIRRCYGVSNMARFVANGFLFGIPNLDNFNSITGKLCVFSKVQAGPKSELHVALLIESDVSTLTTQLERMLQNPGVLFADRNQNCALFLASDGKIYAHNNSKDVDSLPDELLIQLGPGVNPDAVFVSVYGSETDADRGTLAQIGELVGRHKLNKITHQPTLFRYEETSNRAIVDEFLTVTNDVPLKLGTELVLRFLASLQTKHFLILTGLAGSGKTKLAQAFVRWLTESPEHYRLIAVGADWTGSENILGYPNGLDKDAYVTTAALDLILHAHQKQNQHIPHFLILDEMNLSHVERYFADILSAIESGEEIHLHQDEKRVANGVNVPHKLPLPKNLFIIGTVNVDETTYMFSPKVLDRANVIEFRMKAEELESFLAHPVKPNLALLDGKGVGFGQTFVHAAQTPVSLPDDAKDKFEREMLLFFNVMQTHGAEFGYRVAHEAARFVHFYKVLGNFAEGENWFEGAFDSVVIQKFLPKLHGSRAKLGPLLKTLWYLSVNPARQTDVLEKAQAAARSTDKHAEPSSAIPTEAPYPLSADKIARMWRLLRDNGFASFAES